MAPWSAGITVRIAAVVTCRVDTSIGKVCRILRRCIIRSHRPRTTGVSIDCCAHRPRVLMSDVRRFAFLPKYNIHRSRFVKCFARYAVSAVYAVSQWCIKACSRYGGSLLEYKISCRRETMRLLHGSVLANCNWETTLYFESLGAVYTVHLRLIGKLGKHVVDFLLVLIELFAR